MLLSYSRIMSIKLRKHATSIMPHPTHYILWRCNTMAYIVSTRWDYGNLLSHGATEKFLNKLLRVQNKLAQVICNVTTRQQHIIALFHNLHCLLIKIRITLCYKVYRLNQPSYLQATLEPYIPCNGLRSAEMNLLTVPRLRTKTTTCLFTSAVPTVWKRFPPAICNSGSIRVAPQNTSILSLLFSLVIGRTIRRSWLNI